MTPLDIKINVLQQELTALQTDQPAAFAKLKALLAETNQPMAVLMIAGITSGPIGPISIPVTLIPGKLSPAAIQADFVLPSSITFLSATLGPIPAGEGKSIQTNVLSGNTVRVIVFGLNQTPITDGVDFTLNVKSSVKGSFAITMTNPVASDGNGNNLPMCITSGIVGAI